MGNYACCWCCMVLKLLLEVKDLTSICNAVFESGAPACWLFLFLRVLYFHRNILPDTSNIRIVIWACLGSCSMPFDLERGHGHDSKIFVVPPTLITGFHFRVVQRLQYFQTSASEELGHCVARLRGQWRTGWVAPGTYETDVIQFELRRRTCVCWMTEVWRLSLST